MQNNPLAPAPLQVLPDTTNPLTSAAPTPADAYAANMQAYQHWIEQQRAAGVASGELDPQTGWPSSQAISNIPQQYANALIGSRTPLLAQYVPTAMRIGTTAR